MTLRGLVVGHLVLDYVVRGGVVRRALGGTAAYSGVAARRYGAEVALVSKVGPDFPEEYLLFLARSGLDLTHVRLAKLRSTSFKLVYEDGERRLYLVSRCDPITPDDLPSRLDYDFVHVGPVAGEVPLESLRALREGCAGLISLDLQGYVRALEGGLVTYRRSADALEAVRYADIVHGDEREVAALAEPGQGLSDLASSLLELGVKVLLITMGESGSYVVSRDARLYVPAAEPRRVADPTGAGDVYTAIFAAHYAATQDVEESAAMAAAAASLLVEEPGLSGLGTYVEIAERARRVRKRIREADV